MAKITNALTAFIGFWAAIGGTIAAALGFLSHASDIQLIFGLVGVVIALQGVYMINSATVAGRLMK